MAIRLQLISLLVADQAHALDFYTRVLGFEKKIDIPAGDHRWLTVVPAEAPEGPELVLEPNLFAPASTYQKALFEANIPATSFEVDDIEAEVKRLEAAGVQFRMQPTPMGEVSIAVFDDTCGNWIQLHQQT